MLPSFVCPEERRIEVRSILISSSRGDTPSPSHSRVFCEDVFYFVMVTAGWWLQNIHTKGVTPKILAFNGLRAL
jgi:hypothetical protein